MKIIFALFSRYDQADEAMKELLHKKFREEEMNAVAQDYVVKDRMKIKTGGANVSVTEIPPGLDRLMGGQQAVTVNDVGQVFAAGDLATEFTATGNIAGRAGEGLGPALEHFNIPAETSAAYVDGIKSGGVLFWIRTEDERAAEASSILDSHKGGNMASIPH